MKRLGIVGILLVVTVFAASVSATDWGLAYVRFIAQFLAGKSKCT
jgi:hypothetical protein